MMDQKLDSLISRAMRDDHTRSEEAAARILGALAATPLPPQRKGFRWWPSALLNINMEPAWPRVAAFACVAALGMAIGSVAPDTALFGTTVVASTAGDVDLGVFEPELLTGARP